MSIAFFAVAEAAIARSGVDEQSAGRPPQRRRVIARRDRLDPPEPR